MNFINLNIHGVVVSCSTTLSPLLTNISNTEVGIDKDELGNVIMNEFTLEDMLVYVKFCNTGVIDTVGVFNPDLFSYMGHIINDNTKFWIIELMLEWESKLVSNGTDSLVAVDEYHGQIGLLHRFIDGRVKYCASNLLPHTDNTTIEICILEGMDIFTELMESLSRDGLVKCETIEYSSSFIPNEGYKTYTGKIKFVGLTKYRYEIVIGTSVAEYYHNVTGNILYDNKIYRSRIEVYLDDCTNYIDEKFSKTFGGADVRDQTMRWEGKVLLPKSMKDYRSILPDIYDYTRMNSEDGIVDMMTTTMLSNGSINDSDIERAKLFFAFRSRCNIIFIKKYAIPKPTWRKILV